MGMAIRKIDLMHREFGKLYGNTCGECSNFTEYRYDKRYYKCKVYGCTSSEASDWAKKWLACGMFNRSWGDKPIMRLVRPTRKDKEEMQNTPIDGQISLLFADMEEIIDA